LPCAFSIDVAHRDKLRALLGRQGSVQTGMLLAKMSDADDCCS
jgi:hypothetical protein